MVKSGIESFSYWQKRAKRKSGNSFFCRKGCHTFVNTRSRFIPPSLGNVFPILRCRQFLIYCDNSLHPTTSSKVTTTS